MSGPITGQEYAKFERSDATTAFGMRLALGEAVVQLKGLKDVDAEKAKEIFHKAFENNRFLKAAGTQQLVNNYFDQVIDRQADPDRAVRGFLAEIKGVSAEDISNANEGKLSDERLGSLASGFLKSAKSNLGVKTLTEDFAIELKAGKITRDVSITPSGLSQDDAVKLSKMDKTFRRLDNIDDAVYRVVGGMLGNAPAVNHLIAPANPELEREIGTIARAAQSLRDSENKSDAEIRTQAAQIKMAAQRLLGKSKEVIKLPETITANDARAIGEETLRTIVEMRAGEVGDNATGQRFLDIIELKGKLSEKKKTENKTSQLSPQIRTGDVAAQFAMVSDQLSNLKPEEVNALLATAFNGNRPSEQRGTYAASGKLTPSTLSDPLITTDKDRTV